MSNKIFNALLEEKIENFTNAFVKLSKRTFVNEDGKLIHPGEYGSFRESCCKDFLSYFIPQRLSIEEGFLINPEDEVSTECDIIVYDKANTPLIQSKEMQTFYPIETVAAVGEVKSKLTKKQLQDALIKLSKVKTLRHKKEHYRVLFQRNDNMYDPENQPLDNVFTFLICEKLDFDLSDIAVTVNNLYPINTHGNLRHNLILSIQDGLFAYIQGAENNYQIHPVPILDHTPLMTAFVEVNDGNDHIKAFVSFLFSGISDIKLLQPEITSYLLTPYMEAVWAR